MNKNKRIDNPRIKIITCVGAEAQDGKITAKTTMGEIFDIQNSQVSTLSLPI